MQNLMREAGVNFDKPEPSYVKTAPAYPTVPTYSPAPYVEPVPMEEAIRWTPDHHIALASTTAMTHIKNGIVKAWTVPGRVLSQKEVEALSALSNVYEQLTGIVAGLKGEAKPEKFPF